MKKEDILGFVEQAKSIAKNFKDPYKIPVFQVILDKLLTNNLEIAKIEKKEKTGDSEDTGEERIVDVFNTNEIPFLLKLVGVGNKCLILLDYISKKTQGKRGLTTDELKEILADKFGITTVTINNISMNLKNITGKYVTRTKITKGAEKYQYRILENGSKYIMDKVKKLEK